MKQLNIMLLFGALLCIGFSSCSSDDGLPFEDIDAEIELSANEFSFTANDGNEKEVTVNSTANWFINTDLGYPDWIEPSKRDDNTLVVSTNKNDGATIRTGKFEIASGRERRTITVRQAGTETNISISFEPEQLSLRSRLFQSEKVSVVVDSKEDLGWVITRNSDWLTVDVDREKNILSVFATSNSSHRERVGEIVVECFGQESILKVTQDAKAPTYAELTDLLGLAFLAVSENGRYALGTVDNMTLVYDFMTSDFIVLGGSAGIVNPENPRVGLVELYGVSNDGIAVGSASLESDYGSTPCIYDIHANTFTALDITGTKLGDKVSSGSCFAISPDGKVITGYIRPADGVSEQFPYGAYPFVYKDGKTQLLAHPENGFNDEKTIVYSYLPKKISADGSTIFGAMVNSHSARVACYWKLDDPDNVHPILLDNPDFYQTRPYMISTGEINIPSLYPSFVNVSADGKVVTCELIDLRGTKRKLTPFSYNIETKETIVTETRDGEAYFTTPEGDILYGECVGAAVDREAFVYSKGQTYSFEEWVDNKYNLKLPENTKLTLADMADMNGDGIVFVGVNFLGTSYCPVVISL